ncbi:MAG: hypothetical protein ROY82_00035 [Truepera sp.]|nr:hypothetical protein [Truepera sp.]
MKKPPEPLEFFVDRSLGRIVFPGILRKHGLPARVHDEIFSPDTPDEEWITQVAAWGLVAITRDKRIGSTPTELHAVFAAGLRLIVIVGGSVPADELAHNFVKAHSSIQRFVAKHPAPFIAKLSRPASASVLKRGGHGELRIYKSREDLSTQFGGG